MSTSGSPRQRWNLAFMGNAVVMLVLAAIAWLFAGLHEGDGWLASPSRDRVGIATAALLAYAGLVAGCLYRARTHDRAGQPVMLAGQDAVWVVHASQTGFAMELADMTAASLRQGGVAVQRAALEQLDSPQLQAIERAVFVVSTTGEGDPPDPALGFVRHVMSQTLGLQKLRYAVLALGDREYAQFCAFGHQLDDWLRRQGAQPLFDLVEVDNGDDSALRHWQHHIGQLGDGRGAQDWATPRYESWRLRDRVELNPGSVGGPVFHLSLTPGAGPLPDWTAGDIAEIGPCRAMAEVDGVLQRNGLAGDVPVQWQGQSQPLAQVLARSAWPTADHARWRGGAQALADACTPLPHREYSIASLPGDGALHLLVRLMHHQDGTAGLGSGWLCRHAQPGDAIALRIRRNPNFHPPATDVPMILIGNGTGLAGLRAHLKARALAGATRNWLLFGERQRAHDVFFADELAAWHSRGVLPHLDLTFSRDGEAQRYVQHALQAHAERVRQWVEEGAAVYVCGSLAGMAPDVDATLRRILGEDKVEDLRIAGRYRRDVY